MENLRKVLEAYHIFPAEINRVTEQLYRVKGNKQLYSVKKSGLTEKTITKWLSTYRTAQALNLLPILPVYLNQKGQLFTEEGGDYYYVTPWIESDNRSFSYETFFQSLGYVHAKTKQPQRISTENHEQIRENFLVYKQRMGDTRKNLLRQVERYEQKHYMEPVELLVCTQYRDLVQVFYLLDQRLESYLEQLTETNDWRVSLCHGNLTREHVLQHDQTYVINWENAIFQHPIVDLSCFLRDSAAWYDTSTEVLIEKFKFYLEENKLGNHELNLLAIYLLDPSVYIQSIMNTEQRDTNRMEHVIDVQREHRKLLFGIRFSQYVESEFEFVSFDESESER